MVLPPALPPGFVPMAPQVPPRWMPMPMQMPPSPIGTPVFPDRGGYTFPTHPISLDPGATFFTYESAKERKYFEKATEALDTKYDGSAKGLLMFITKVELKSEMFGWETILSIPTAIGTLSLLNNHGQITIADIHQHAMYYLNAQGRERQDAHHLKLFLGASLTDTFMMRVLAHKSQYILGGVQHGPSMFSVILSLVGLHSKATVAAHYKTVGHKDYVFCPNHESTKWVIAEKHKNGCTKEPGWTFPMKGTTKAHVTTPTLTPTLKPVDKQYAKALMSVMDYGETIEFTDAYEAEENI
jgi:hypothetical protein